MSEKKESKYVGGAKANNYGLNGKININQLFSQLYQDTKDERCKTIFNQLRGLLEEKQLDYINIFEKKDKNKVFELKININKKKEEKFFQTHSIQLNEWRKENKDEDNELPF